MWKRRAAATACGLAALLAAGCGRPITQPVINSAQLVGTWTGPDGAVMTFKVNQTVVVRHLSLVLRGCTNVSGGGTWQFDSLQGDSGLTSYTYSKSNIIEVDFFSPSACNSQFTTWKDNPLTMCLDIDPDSPCSHPVFTKQSTAKS